MDNFRFLRVFLIALFLAIGVVLLFSPIVRAQVFPHHITTRIHYTIPVTDISIPLTVTYSVLLPSHLS